ncbi:MAG TPA: ABC transporter permease [Burkholderiales bacterium]|jgi:lipooligosaccharide transport system permease protein
MNLRFVAVWRRNFLVWRKLAIPSILGNLADPLIFLFGLGYGLGSLLGNMGGTSYFAFLAGGFLASSSMFAASFEALYSAFSRMHVQKTWDAILNAPMSLVDVVAGEWVWAATKSLAAGICMLLVVSIFGFAASPLALAAIPAVALVGLAFAGLGLVINSMATGYDFFSYYMTLALTPMMMLSGVFFPTDQLPAAVQWAAQALPLWHGVALTRPLLLGEVPQGILLHVAVLLAYAVGGFYLAVVLTRRRLLT